jgi:hypothetical protein
LRESVRQDLLVERYADLQEEMEGLEKLLDIESDEKKDKTSLLKINEMLFEIIETMIPELRDSSSSDDRTSLSEEKDLTTRIKIREYIVRGLNERGQDYEGIRKDILNDELNKAKDNLGRLRQNVNEDAVAVAAAIVKIVGGGSILFTAGATAAAMVAGLVDFVASVKENKYMAKIKEVQKMETQARAKLKKVYKTHPEELDKAVNTINDARSSRGLPPIKRFDLL